MKIEQNQNLHHYFRYFSYIPILYQKKEVTVCTELILSLLSIAILCVFALSPTVTAITGLIKENQDTSQLEKALQEKIDNLNQAHGNLKALTDAQPLILQALPQTPSPDNLSSQLELLAKKFNLNLHFITFEPIPLRGDKLIKTTEVNEVSLSFSISGDFANMINFAKSLEKNRRIIKISSLTISQSKTIEDNKETTGLLRLTAWGTAYFLPITKELK